MDRQEKNELSHASSEQKSETDEKEGVSAFYASLQTLCADDIAPVQKKFRLPSAGRICRMVAFLLFCAIFLRAGYTVVYNLISYKIADDRYQSLANKFSMNTSLESATRQLFFSNDALALPTFSRMLAGNFEYKPTVPAGETARLAVYRARHALMQQQNPDVYGWISVEGTNIDYPIVQGEDNEFYLDHDFSKEYYTVGSIYADYRCEKSLRRNLNLVIYGHNIRTRGIMFNQLLRFTDQNFFNDHSEITIYTPEGIYVYEIFSFFQTVSDGEYAYIYFSEDENFIAHCKKMYQLSWYQRAGVDENSFRMGTRLLTLSTCTNGDAEERYAVVAFLKSAIEA